MTRITRISFTLLLAAFAAVAGPACSLVPAGRAPVLVYTVSSISDGFEVRLDARDLPGRRPAFRLLESWGALADMPGHIEDIRAADATGAEIGLDRTHEDGEGRWKLSRNPGRFTLTYRVRGYDPMASPEASFVTDGRFVWIGYSVLLTPVNLGARAPASLSIHVCAPVGWEIWGSWPQEDGAYRPANLHDAWSGFAAAGDFKPSHLSSDRAAVTVLTEGTASAGLGLHIANRLLPVLREMVALFGAPPRGDRLDVLALYRVAPTDGRRSIVSGTSQEGAFLCLATPDRFNDMEGLTALAAHECFHFYIGGAVIASPEPPFQNAPDLIWLMEGVTEYMAFRLMERSGVLTPAGFGDVARRKEAEWRATPGHRDLTLAEAARAMNDLSAYSLVYSRGFLVARLIDERMETVSGPGALDRTLRRLFEEHNRYEGAGLVTEAQVVAAFEERAPASAPASNGTRWGGNRCPPSNPPRLEFGTNEERRPKAPLLEQRILRPKRGLEILGLERLALVAHGPRLGFRDEAADLLVQGAVEVARHVALLHRRLGARLRDDQITTRRLLVGRLLGRHLLGHSFLLAVGWKEGRPTRTDGSHCAPPKWSRRN